MDGKKPDFVFVHLSDIHFRKGKAGDVHDQDADLRNELEIDLRNAGSLVPRIDAIVVSGDIAFAADESEYKLASAWLNAIRENVSCPGDAVLVTPGNHDVDRGQLPDGCETLALHERIQGVGSSAERDELIATSLRDPKMGGHLFAPLAEYNKFAKGYGCDVSPNAPFWERPFPLSDGSTLLIRGMSTTLISGPRDKVLPRNLAYGGAQKQFLRSGENRRVLVGHHPPSWTLDSDDAAQVFALRNLLQLFGHRHSQWIAKEANSVRIIAGAVHPDERELLWEPRYNIVALTVTAPTSLMVRVFPRKWSREEMIFAADRKSDGSIDREHTLEIDAHPTPTAVQIPRTHTTAPDWGTLSERLARLAPGAWRAIASELGLFVPVSEQPRRLVALAAAAGKLTDLEEKLAATERAEREHADVHPSRERQ